MLCSTKQSGSVQFSSVQYTLEPLFLRFHYQKLWMVPIEQFHTILFFITSLMWYPAHWTDTKRQSYNTADGWLVTRSSKSHLVAWALMLDFQTSLSLSNLYSCCQHENLQAACWSFSWPRKVPSVVFQTAVKVSTVYSGNANTFWV